VLQLEGFEPAPIPGPAPTGLVSAADRLRRFLDDPVRELLALREYGDIVGVVEADPAIVCVYGAKYVRRVLESPQDFQNLESFPHRRGTSPALDVTDRGLPRMNGLRHERHRRLLRRAFEPDALDDRARMVVRVAAAVVEQWPLDGIGRVDQLCRDLVRSVALTALLGVPPTSGGLELGELIAKLHAARVAPMSWVPEVNLPGAPHRRANLLAREVVKRLEAVIEAKRPGSRDALGQLVEAARDESPGLSSDEQVGLAVTLFSSSHEPTAMALAWTLFLLDQHPGRLEAIQTELDEVLAEQRPTRDDLPRLGKLDRAVKESLRLLPPMPVLGYRVVAQPTEIGSVPLPPGANVVVSPLAQHHDPARYREPRTFDPDRWFELSPEPFVYLPFGGGPRACLAQAFANETLRLVLAVILQQRRLRCRPGARIDRLVRGQVMQFAHGLPMRITRPKEPTDPAHPIQGDVRQLVDLPDGERS